MQEWEPPDSGALFGFFVSPADRKSQGILEGIKVLVVDDLEDNRIMLFWILNGAGAIVRAEESVDQALVAIGEFKPDVIVSDISMPDRDGHDLIRTLRKGIEAHEGHKTPAIAVSAHANPALKQKSLSEGFQVHIGKPVDRQLLLGLVKVLAELDGKAVKYGFDPSAYLSSSG
ncbi:MAG TPA: response regulator [Oligoflexus sp.]|uniref:response regulator n=1 Tax=Oligoflexus sp. TaxID=1971216 RepID=UPI002D472F1F|nr:response regulator [Oligoflexus sp.]HYX36778.1 response regulator [Oligoflexus sp.]